MQYEKCVDCIHKKILYNNKNLEKIYRKSLESIDTRNIIRDAVKLNDKHLKIFNRNYELKRKCYVVGFGKAVFNMAIELESILGPNLAGGICSIPAGFLSREPNRRMAAKSQIKFQEGAKNNLPDASAESTAREILDLIKPLEKDDLLIVLISGGGSALLPLPKPPITVDEISMLVKGLARNGANIIEINSVRKRLSVLKGGGLARYAFPASVVSLILSDCIGDPIDFIASGPTTPNSDPPEAAMDIITEYKMSENLSKEIKACLTSEMDDATCEIRKTPLGEYIHVENMIIGNNKIVAEAAKADAIRRGYQAVILSVEVEGDVADISRMYASICAEIAELVKDLSTVEYLEYKLKSFQEDLGIPDENIQELLNLDFKTDKGICLILAGEPTLKVRGAGKGGRNLHLALQFSVDIAREIENGDSIENVNISLLSCGTDGIDGPTDAAGALGTSDIYAIAKAKMLCPERFLRNYDSYGFYEQLLDGKYMIKTGHTGTNVMDLHLMIVNKGYVYEDDDHMSRLRLIAFSQTLHC